MGRRKIQPEIIQAVLLRLHATPPGTIRVIARDCGVSTSYVQKLKRSGRRPDPLLPATVIPIFGKRKGKGGRPQQKEFEVPEDYVAPPPIRLSDGFLAKAAIALDCAKNRTLTPEAWELISPLGHAVRELLDLRKVLDGTRKP